MASELKVNKISPESGTTLTLGDSGDTINFGSGVLPNFENLTVTGDLTVDTNSLKVDSTNNFVGIGTASPSVALDVVGAITATGNITGTLATAAQPNITSLGTLTGLTTTGNINLGDSDKINFGASNDLQIYHDGSNSYVSDEGTGNLIIAGSTQTAIRGTTAGDNIAVFNNAADVKLYYNGASKLATTSTGIDVTGTAVTDGLTVNSGTTDVATRFESTDDTAGVALSDQNGSILLLTRDTGDFSVNVGGSGSSSGSGSSEAMRITSAGLVGIGTSSPDEELHIQSSVNNIVKSETTTSTALGGFEAHGNSTSFLKIFQLGSSYGGTTFGGVTGNNQALIEAQEASSLAFTTQGGTPDIIFAPARTARMTIKNGGNVGIGTSSPTYALDVESANSYLAHFVGTGTNAFTQLTTTTHGVTSSDGFVFGIDSNADCYIINRENASLRFFTNNQERARFTNGGRLGIGTTNPTHELMVAGGTDTRVTIDGSTSSGLYLTDSGASGVTIRNTNNGDLEFLGVSGKSFVFNQASINTDFRIESDANANMFFVDASTNRVGIGTGSPEGAFHVQGSQIKVKHSTSAFVTIEAGSASYQSILEFSDGGASGALIYDHPSNYLATKVNGSEAMRIDSSGVVMIGTTTSSPVSGNVTGVSIDQNGNIEASRTGGNPFAVNRTNDGTITEYRRGGTTVGSVSVTSSGTTYNTTSDYRLKDNIEIITDGTERLMKLKPVRHSWKESSVTVDGFLAHEVQEAGLEYAVTGEKDGKEMQSMDYGRITPILVSALQNAINEINSLKQQIQKLEVK